MNKRPNWRKALRDSIDLRWALMAKGEEPLLIQCPLCAEHDRVGGAEDCDGCPAEDGPLCHQCFGAWREAKSLRAKTVAARGMVEELTRLLKVLEVSKCG